MFPPSQFHMSGIVFSHQTTFEPFNLVNLATVVIFDFKYSSETDYFSSFSELNYPKSVIFKKIGILSLQLPSLFTV